MTINWWQARRENLLLLAAEECPLYIYNEETINDTFFDLLSIDALNGLFYPVYLNPHPKVLKKAFEMDLGFLCATTNEFKGLLDKFPELNAQRILFLHDDACDRDVEKAFHYGAHLIVSNPQILKACPATSQDRGFFVFLDPETTPEAGLWSELWVSGFYTHQNTVFSSSNDANKIISLITDASKRFPEASILILGNVPDVSVNHQDWKMDIQILENCLEVINDVCPQFTLWLEVPAQTVSSMGALLFEVTETGEKEGIPHIRINMDMKPIIKNRLHEEGRQIFNLSTLDEEKTIMTRIMGRNQDYGDADLTKVPDFIEEGNILLLTNMGICEPCRSFKDEGRDGVPEHYLPARRICQVKV
jgi:diaminopimelate decarboxylase